MTASEGTRYLAFNTKLQQQLNSLVFEINKLDKGKETSLIGKKTHRLSKIIFAFPAFLGWLMHLPLYIPSSKNHLYKDS